MENQIQKNIALIGMMGTFKSSAGKLAAEKLDLAFYDSDSLIEEECGQSISEIFATYGEEYFREKETQSIKKLSLLKRAVISCGGGVVLKKENIESLKQNGIIILLKASAEAVYERVRQNKNRPLIGAAPTLEGISAIMAKRKALYEGCCDYAIDNTFLTSVQTAEQIVKIVKIICQESQNSI